MIPASNLPSPETIALASPVLPAALANFSYAAQTEQGLRITGIIEAPDGATVVRVLESMHLRVTSVTASKDKQPTAVGDSPFLIFNQRLAQLSKSGLPIEKGMRLIAADMRRGRMKRKVAAIARELEQGVPLAEAFEKHRRGFPSLYGRLIDAGIRGGDLPGVLLNIGRQVEMQQRLRAALWRSVAYPMATLCALLVILAFVGLAVIPRLQPILADFHLPLSPVTRTVFVLGSIAPYLAAGAIALAVIGAISWLILRAVGADAVVADRLLLPVPFVGPVLRFNLIARWVDVVRIGVSAGLDLPAAIELAGDATASPALRRDGKELTAALAAGSPPATVSGRLLPATVPMAIEFSANPSDLPGTLQTLCDLYERQAELRLERIPSILTPLLIILIGALVGFVMCGLLMPLAKTLEYLTR